MTLKVHVLHYIHTDTYIYIADTVTISAVIFKRKKLIFDWQKEEKTKETDLESFLHDFLLFWELKTTLSVSFFNDVLIFYAMNCFMPSAGCDKKKGLFKRTKSINVIFVLYVSGWLLQADSWEGVLVYPAASTSLFKELHSEVAAGCRRSVFPHSSFPFQAFSLNDILNVAEHRGNGVMICDRRAQF